MNFPRLKNALLCRIIMYVALIGGCFLPWIIIGAIKPIPDIVKIPIIIAFLIGALIYLIKNFAVIFTVDAVLATLDCYNNARKQFVLPDSFSVQRVENKISQFGKGYEPIAVSPRPEMLQYKSNASATIYASGIEKVIATYHTERLDKALYLSIVNSATANSKALSGSKKHRFLDKEQKSSPLNRVTVIVIFAKSIDDKLQANLFDTVCKNEGDGFDVSVLPCVIDLENQTCTFNSMREIYMGFQYPVKSRGIRMIKKYIFDGKLPLKHSPDMLAPPQEIDLDFDQSLWSFWISMKNELILEEKRSKKRFEEMAHGEIILEEDFLYVKWNEHGLSVAVELNEELKVAEIDLIDLWDYPKSNKISKKAIAELKNLINTHFACLGYTTKYFSLDEIDELEFGNR